MPKNMPKKSHKKRKKNKLNLTRTKFKSPTTLSIFPEKSPQLQDKEASILNAFTTKNVQVLDKNYQIWNSIENGKLAYKRSARGAYIGTFPTVVYGSHVERLTKHNYKQLTAGTEIYYDRNSVLLRGPFIYQKTLRGPNLLFTIKDVGYKNKIYEFTIPVSKLASETLYFIKKDVKKSKKNITKQNKTRKKKYIVKYKGRSSSKK